MLSDRPKTQTYYIPKSTSPQSLAIFFGFEGQSSAPDTIGCVQFTLIINLRRFGPYCTDINVTKSVWDARIKPKVPEPSQRLLTQLIALQGRLLEAWAGFDQLGEKITGPMVLTQAGLPIIEAEGGPEYAL